jgi:CheY-like chemotaxis protein
VLIVDDDGDIAAMMARIVTFLGHEAVACSDARQAVDRLGMCGACSAPRGCAGRFDVVIADYRMVPDGIAVLKAYVTDSLHRILFTASSYATPEVRAAMMDDIIHVVLTKPATIAEIRFAIDAAHDPR